MAYLINEDFNGWSGTLSPDGVWRINGPWYGTNNVYMEPSLASFTSTLPGETDTGFLGLTITPSKNPLEGSEIQTTTGYGYGYYEVRMEPSAVSGGVASFFLMGAPNYTFPEFDIEFLLNSKNQVTFTDHGTTGTAGTTYYNLGFDPTAAFHTYGIDWEPNADGTATVTDYVDGTAVHSEASSGFVLQPGGEFIMMDAWSGNPNWGGGPPATNSTSYYDWVHYTASGTPPPPPPPPPPPDVVAPTLTIADTTLSVSGRGGTVGLGVNVTTTDSNDRVTLQITGLPKYESITDNLDHFVFKGSNVTLTEAQVDSGLTLTSNYHGSHHPIATLTLTATATDPVSGDTLSAPSQTITVTDPVAHHDHGFHFLV